MLGMYEILIDGRSEGGLELLKKLASNGSTFSGDARSTIARGGGYSSASCVRHARSRVNMFTLFCPESRGVISSESVTSSPGAEMMFAARRRSVTCGPASTTCAWIVIVSRESPYGMGRCVRTSVARTIVEESTMCEGTLNRRYARRPGLPPTFIVFVNWGRAFFATTE